MSLDEPIKIAVKSIVYFMFLPHMWVGFRPQITRDLYGKDFVKNGISTNTNIVYVFQIFINKLTHACDLHPPWRGLFKSNDWGKKIIICNLKLYYVLLQL